MFIKKFFEKTNECSIKQSNKNSFYTNTNNSMK